MARSSRLPTACGGTSFSAVYSRVSALLRVVQMLVGIIERAAVVRAQDEEAHHLGIVLLQHLADGEEVAERLGHLLVVDAHEAVVHPVVHERRRRARLRSARSRSRDAGTAGPGRRRGCRNACRAALHDIAEHSMCQPGRPLPHGESQAGSPSLACFHSTKSSGSCLPGSTSTRSPARRSSSDLPDSLP